MNNQRINSSDLHWLSCVRLARPRMLKENLCDKRCSRKKAVEMLAGEEVPVPCQIAETILGNTNIMRVELITHHWRGSAI